VRGVGQLCARLGDDHDGALTYLLITAVEEDGGARAKQSGARLEESVGSAMSGVREIELDERESANAPVWHIDSGPCVVSLQLWDGRNVSRVSRRSVRGAWTLERRGAKQDRAPGSRKLRVAARTKDGRAYRL